MTAVFLALLHIRGKKSIRLNLNIYPLYCTVEKLRGKKYHLRVARAVSKKIPAEDAACCSAVPAANLRDLTLYHFDLHGR